MDDSLLDFIRFLDASLLDFIWFMDVFITLRLMDVSQCKRLVSIRWTFTETLK